jgi:hypothetical protein
VNELAKMGFANMQDYMGATDNGDPFLDFSKLTRAKAAALAEVAVEKFVDGRLRECARGQARQVQAARQARCAGGPGPSSRHVSGREPGRRREFSCNFEFWQAPGRALNPAIDLGRAARDRVGAIGSGCGLFLLGGPALHFGRSPQADPQARGSSNATEENMALA